MKPKLSLPDRTRSPRHRPRLVSNRASEARDFSGAAEYYTPSKSAPLPSRYQVEASDAKGRSVNFSVSMPPEYRRTASKFVQSHEFGFETEQDALRWAIDHGFKELGKRVIDPDAKSTSQFLQMMISFMKEQMAYYKMESHLHTYFAGVDRLTETGNYSAAETAVDKVIRGVDGILDRYWRKKYFDMATEKLKEVRKAARDAQSK